MYTIAQPLPIVIDAIPTVANLRINGTSDPTNSTPCSLPPMASPSSSWTPPLMRLHATSPFESTIRLDLSDLMQEGNVYVSVNLLQNGKLNVFICTEDKTIYDEDHELSA